MANDFTVRDLIAGNIYVSDSQGNIVNTFTNQTIGGSKTFANNTIFNGTSIIAQNQTITNSSSILTKGIGDSLYGVNYFSITTGLSSGVDNDSIGVNIHSFTLPSGTYEFNSYVAVSGTVTTGGQGLKFYFYPSNTYSFYGEGTRNTSVSYTTPQSMTAYNRNSNLPFLSSSTTSSLVNYCNVNGILVLNQTSEVPIYIGQTLQATGQPVYLLPGSYLKARKLN